MKYEDQKNDFLNAQAYTSLGINDYSKKLDSYSKCFNNKNYLSYELDAIYLVDKLHLTFTSTYTSFHFSELNNFENDINYTYKLDKFINLQKVRNPKFEFRYNYLVVVSGMSYANLYLSHVHKKPRVKIELINRFIYTQTTYDMMDNLLKISKNLDLTFCNVSNYELARDTTQDIYNRYGIIFHQSNICPSQALHSIGGKPKYKSFGKTSYNPVIADSKNPDYGTAYIGSSKSAIQLKIYSKSNELSNKKNRKNYIKEIYIKHFGGEQDVTRVEARVTSAIINKYGWDLFDLLNEENHQKIFYTLVGDKLTFRNLQSKKYDKNRNPKYELIKLLPDPIGSKLLKKITVRKNPYKTHSNGHSKPKIMIHLFLEKRINVHAIYGFIKTEYWEIKIPLETSINELENAMKTYTNPMNNKVFKKHRFISDLIESGGNKFKVVKAYWHYLI